MSINPSAFIVSINLTVKKQKRCNKSGLHVERHLKTEGKAEDMDDPTVNLSTEKMQTLSQCMTVLKEKGFVEEFRVSNTGLSLPEKQKTYDPSQIRIVNFYRFEGESDPSDNSILYAIETHDGIKGVLTDAYGPYADKRTSEFIKQVEEIQKEKGLSKK